jgi:hypothetical protein
MYDLSSAAVRSTDAPVDAFSRFQYLKRNPAVVATLSFTKKLFDNPPLNSVQKTPM